MTVQGIIKRAIKRLELEGKILTPDAYAEAFCKEAKKAGVKVEDCSHLQNMTQGLSKELQKDLAAFRIQTINELVRFLSSKLSRSNPTQCADLLEAQTTLTKRILQVVEVLHNKEAAELAHKSLDLITNAPSATQLNQFRQLWVNFLTTYDDSFLQKLQQFGTIETQDLKKSITNLNLSNIPKTEMLEQMSVKKIAALLVASFVPSIASSANDKIASLSARIKKDPTLLESANIAGEIKSTIALRIALDKKSVKEMVQALDGVVDKLSLRLISMIESSDASNADIQKIKKELERYNQDSGTNFKVAHQKLYTIAVALEENTQILSRDLKDHNGEITKMSQKIRKLEAELEKTKKESKEDFLTKLYNKRALDEFLEIKEAEFQRYDRNYSIVMFDIDFFKKVNDTFGHDAGDAVLAAFAKILKEESRSVDVVGRFGGEEFLAILSDTDSAGGFIFAQKVRKHVQKARFMYNKERIQVTVSAGISDRKKHVSLQATVNSADEYLYKAKHEGRNRAEYQK